jgi:CRISPR-associated protein Cas1
MNYATFEMKRNYYIFTPGRLRRKENTIFFVPFTEIPDEEDENIQNEILLEAGTNEDEIESFAKKVVLPIQDIESFYLMTDITFNSRFMEFIGQNNIPLHMFNRYGYYSGSFYPREYLLSGYLTIHQTQSYLAHDKRLEIARKFVKGAAGNLVKNLRYYNNRDKDLQAQIDTIESIMPEIDNAAQIDKLMSVEAHIRKVYYSGLNEILEGELNFSGRSYNPPSNPINALISFNNSLVYTTVLSEIYHTQLDPTISFLHQPGVRRFSLALDIAEIFKPLLADRMMFKLINKKIIGKNDFEDKLNGSYLKEKGRKKVIEEFDGRLKTTIKHRKLNKSVSYRRLIRLECYKLIKHLLGEKEYEPFVIWW